MDCVPVPDEARAMYPNAETKVFAPPSGDLLDDDIRGAEVIVDVDQSVQIRGVPSLHLYFRLDAEDLKRLQNDDPYLELTILGVQMPPVSLNVI